MISGENPILIGQNSVELQLVKELQISRRMTIYGQNLGGFKRENNECIRNGELTKLHKIKIVVFLFGMCGAMTRISSRFMSL